MQPHEQRVVDEATELNIKIDKLVGFTTTAMFRSLPSEEQKLFAAQGLAMSMYLVALERRIERFTKG